LRRNRLLVASLAAAIALSVLLIDGFYSYSSSSSCSGGTATTVQQSYQQAIQNIEQNATFKSLEDGKPYQYSSVSAEQASYLNGTIGPLTLTFTFACGSGAGSSGCGIDAVVNSQNEVVSVHRVSPVNPGGGIYSNPPSSYSC
jgi:hypothetical protein